MRNIYYIILQDGVPVDVTNALGPAKTRLEQWKVPGKTTKIEVVESSLDPWEEEKTNPDIEAEMVMNLEFDSRHGGYNER